jgi:hypothetical protein
MLDAFFGRIGIHQNELSAFHQPKVKLKNKISSGDCGSGQVTLTWINVLHDNLYNAYPKTPKLKSTANRFPLWIKIRLQLQILNWEQPSILR